MNKRHYEHTLPNIRGSLSNTYKNGNRMDKEIAEEIIRENRYPSGYDIQDYLFDNEDTVLSLEDGTELLDDFDLWKERSDLELEKIMDRNYWSSTGGY